MLPVAKEKIWLVSAVEKWLKQTILYLVIGSIVVLVTPISSMLVFTYISLLLTMDIIMTIPQWKLFQVRVLPKLGWIGLILVINVIGILTIAPVAGITMVGIILMRPIQDRKSTRLNSSHVAISYAVFCLKKKNKRT